MENSDYNVCPECGTENEPEYIYCKNCGTCLTGPACFESSGQNFIHSEKQPADNFSHEDKTYTRSNFTHAEREPVNNFSHNASDYGREYGGNSNFNHNAERVIVDNIEGIPTDEVAAFVGSKAPQYIEKFSKMEISRSKVSWCWPAAILGFIFGPLGSAIWFLYRKMYKIAFMLIAAGLIIGCINSVVMRQVVSEMPESIVDYIQEGDYASIINDIYYIRGYSGGFIEYLSLMVTCVLTGIFGIYAYKRHTVKKISEYRTVGADPRYYNIGLHTIGGTSAGMALLGVVIMVAASNMMFILTKIL